MRLKKYSLVFELKKDFQNVLIKEKSFELIFQIANGSKHLQVDDNSGKSITETKPEGGHYQGLLALGTATHLVMYEGKNKYFLIQELKNVKNGGTAS